MHDTQILIKPVITEKATAMGERHNQVVFKVLLGANKYQIERAVEAAYKVKVADVRTMVMPGKLKRRGKSIGKKPNWKKAIISLAEGDKIDFYAAE
jgi:large subunit ribosomal protein L23